MNCNSCGRTLPQAVDPTERFVICADCGVKNGIAGVEECTQAAAPIRPPSRRSVLKTLVGRTLGNGMYRIDSEIGGGGMAKVYCATQIRLDRRVAVKVLPQELTEDPSFVQRFKREATVLAKFSHSNIVPVFDTGEEEGIHYIVMGYIEGAGGNASTLRDLIDTEPLDVQHATRIMGQCLSALQYAHEKSIIHRDVKPGNILIDANGDAHLADFGIASSRGTVGDATLTVSGSTLGTARYMAPEQQESATQADARSDLYSMGLVFYEMLVGYVPEATTFLPRNLLASKKQSKAFILPSVFKPGKIDERLDQIVLRAMQPDPADRFQSAAEMLRALTEAVGGSVSGSPRRNSRKRPPSRLLRLTTAVIILGAVGCAGVYFLTVRNRIPSDLLTAIKNADDNAAIAIVEKQPDLINSANVDGLTPLHHAAIQNRPLVIRKLIEKNANIEAKDRKGRTPLHHAGEGIRPDAALVLIEKQANLNAKDNDGRTPLHLAALADRTALVLLLIEKGASVDARDNEGRIPQQMAKDETTSVFERSELIYLIGHQDATTKARIGKLVKSDMATNPNAEGWTVLHFAAFKGDEYTCSLLLNAGAEVNQKTNQEYKLEDTFEAGCTPLLLACEYSNTIGDKAAGVAKLLLDKGASAGLSDATGRTPLYWAAKNSNAEIARLLLEKKADPDAKTKDDGLTPLHVAAQAGSADIVKLLLECNADPMTADASGRTALCLAAAAGHRDVTKTLLPLRVSNSIRIAARKLARDSNHDEIVALFDEWWIKELFSVIEHPAEGSEYLKTVGELMSWPRPHSAATTRPSDGQTPLAVAVTTTRPSRDVLKLLLDAEPRMIDQPDASGETPLYVAVRCADADVVAFLVANYDRKSMDANDSRGQRLLNVAAAASDVNMIDLLVKKYQLNINTADAQGITPLQLAATRLEPEIVQRLLDNGAKADAKALQAAAQARLATKRSADDRANEALTKLGVALLMDQLKDPEASKQSATDVIAKLDTLKLDLLDKPLPDGQMPLHMAVVSASPEVKSLMIEKAGHRKLLDKQDAAGETALHAAARLGPASVVQMLLDGGANYKIKDSAGRMPEDVAKAAQQNETELALAERRRKDEAEETNKQQEALKAKERADQVAREKAKADEIAKEKFAQENRDRIAREKAEKEKKEAADAAAANAWFDDIRKKHRTLSITGVDKLDFNVPFPLPVGAIIQLRSNRDAIVECGCGPDGTLTITVEGGWPALGKGIAGQRVKEGRARINGRIVLQRVAVQVQTYSGKLVAMSEGRFEWRVGNLSPVVFTEKNPSIGGN